MNYPPQQRERISQSASKGVRAGKIGSDDVIGVATGSGDLVYINRAGRRLTGNPPQVTTLQGLISANAQSANLFGADIYPHLIQHGAWMGSVCVAPVIGDEPQSSIIYCRRIDAAGAFVDRWSGAPQALFFMIRPEQSDWNKLEPKPVDTHPTAAELAGITTVTDTHPHDVLDILSDGMNADGLRRFAEMARRLCGARYAVLCVSQRAGRGNTGEAAEPLCIGAGLTDEKAVRISTSQGFSHVVGMLMHSRVPVRFSNMQTQPGFAGFCSSHPEIRAFLGVPITRGGKTLGCLYLTDKMAGGGFTDRDHAVVQALGVQCAILIQFLGALHRQQVQVQEMFDAVIEPEAGKQEPQDGLTEYALAAYTHLQAYHETVRWMTAADTAELHRSARVLDEAA